MVDFLDLRIKLLALGAAPTVALLLAGAIAASGDGRVAAAVAIVGAALTIVATVLTTTIVSTRAADLAERAELLVGDSYILNPGPRDELARLDDVLGVVERRVAALAEAVAHRDDQIATGDIVAALAERLRDLVDRQLVIIDLLEAGEQEPGRLEQLFALDHLACQLRRAAESMVVAGGADPTSYRGGPAPITDVLRVAIGTVSAYERVEVTAVDDVLVAGQPGFELAQLVAELVDNATRHSPDGEQVDVLATGLDSGDYRISVVDHGVGMDDHLLATTNDVVADPPPLEAGAGAAIGLVAVGRLARRIGASVRLSAPPQGGVVAEVTIPASMIVADVPGRPPVAREARSAKRHRRRISRQPVGDGEGDRTAAAGDHRASTGGRFTGPGQGAAARRVPPPLGRSEREAARPAVPAAVAKLMGLEQPPSRSLDDAVPTGDRFEAGVIGLLQPGNLEPSTHLQPDTSPWSATPQGSTGSDPEPAAGGPAGGEPLARRERRTWNDRFGAPTPFGPSSMVTRYREGLASTVQESGPERPTDETERPGRDDG